MQPDDNAENEMLRVRGLQKSFGARRVLSADFFVVNKGECALIFGDNGCGKTTFLKILAGLLKPDAIADYCFNGFARLPPCGANGAALLHQTPFMFSASVRANVAIAASGNAKIDDALNRAGLSGLSSANARDLSGGERARVSLARAHAANMQLCLMDEPAAHLDADGQALAADLIHSVLRRNASVVVAAPSLTNAKTIPFHRAWHLNERGCLAESTPQIVLPPAACLSRTILPGSLVR